MNYEHCTLCPRRCGVNRLAGERGYCGMPAKAMVAKAMLHYGEEPPISGSYGTGAVFFSGCTLRCAFCQNREISFDGVGRSTKHLRRIFEQLIDEGAQSIDLVTPTHFLPDIIPALTPKLPVPVVYNCGGYESVESLKRLEGLVDIYLPDFKYSDNRLAMALSKAPDYFEVASAAIQEMYRQTGPVVIEDDIMQRGVLMRHLVLPGYVDNSLGVIDWVSEQFPGDRILFSLMRQYTPMGNLAEPMNRKVTDEEYDACVSWMEFCGIENGFTQGAEAATTEYLPDFDLGGIL